MKRFIILTIILILIQSTSHSQTTYPKSLTIGNEFHYALYGDSGFYGYSRRVVTGDTIINNNTYAVLELHGNSDNLIFQRTDSTNLYQIIGGLEKLIFSLNWNVGDTVCSGTACEYNVTSKDTIDIIGSDETRVALYKSYGDEESYSLQYCSKFGLKRYGNDLFGTTGARVLVGAIVDGVIYGDIQVNIHGESSPDTYSLMSVYPNPFNNAATIFFTSPMGSHVVIELYNILGQRVEKLFEGIPNNGINTVSINSTDLVSGIYIVRMIGNGFVNYKKISLVK